VISDEASKLLQIMQEDPVIKKRISELLRLTAFERRSILNVWLEQLGQRNAPKRISRLLSFLFDDNIAQQTPEMMIGKINEK
jgi:hypothetical protein